MFIERIADIIVFALRDSYDRFGQEIDPLTYFAPCWCEVVIGVECYRYDYEAPMRFFDILEVIDF